MKKFTRVCLGAATTCVVISAISLLIAWNLGLSMSGFKQMLADGSFSIDLDGFFIWDWDGGESRGGSGTDSIEEEIENLDIEFGAGRFVIEYADVEQVEIEWNNVVSFSTKVKDNTLKVEGGLGVNFGSSMDTASLKITVPKDMKLKKVDLEIGACDAEIKQITAEEVYVSVGAGKAGVSELTTDVLDIEVGAGKAEFTAVDAKHVDLEVGVGDLEVEVVGGLSDYNYSVDCAIGDVEVGGHSYSGFANTDKITNKGAEREMDIDCGIGKVKVEFTEE